MRKSTLETFLELLCCRPVEYLGIMAAMVSIYIILIVLLGG